MPSTSHSEPQHMENRPEIRTEDPSTPLPPATDKVPFLEPMLLKRGSISTLTTDFGVDSHEVKYES